MSRRCIAFSTWEGGSGISIDAPIEVILNARAGGGTSKTARAVIEALFRRHGRSASVVVAGDSKLNDLALAKARGPGTLVVAGGGDGTIAGVAAALVGTQKILGVLPMGTLNHFSKDLGIPQDLESAVETMVTGVATRVDVGEVNGRVFLNNSSLGVYPAVVADRDRQRRRLRRGKWSAFAAALMHLLQRYPRLDLRLTVEGQKLTRRSPFLFVGNNPYELAGFDLGARHRLDSGKLGVYVTPRTGRFDLFWLLARGLLGRLQQDRDFESFRVEEVVVETSRRDVLVAADGELVRMTSPLRYRVHPRALRVMVPRAKAHP